MRQLREAGLTPAVTLLHLTLPLWVADRSGVARRPIPGRRSASPTNVMLLEPAFRLLLTDWLSAAYVDGSRTGPSPTACATGARLRLSGATLDERIDGLVGSADFFGLNYYFRYFVRMAPASPETA